MLLNDGYVYREKLGRQPGRSALAHLTDTYRHSSEEEWRARFARGEVRLDGVVADGSEPLRPGQWLCWHRPPWEEEDTPRSFELVYEDAELVVVVKPSGLPTLPSGGFLKNTLLSFVQARWPEAVPRHRLGRATSGLVLFTRTREAAARLARDWREGRVHKRYRALSQGLAAQESYDIRAPIGLVPHPRLGEVHGASARGKPSHSTARVLERRTEHTLFEVDIHTGRSEQIRIHLAYIGHPLVGDPLFAVGGLPLAKDPGLPGDGGYLLHAESLTFRHPRSGEQVQLQAPPPPELRVQDASR
ncbi:RluA family pseudouridine synthase [Corallococcus macrosporus]|uniref:RNA pseudouridine synthase n=1 Tax=Corallococcus macrosporus DSM 14697 TaxID=1189310 RepID=A0A250K0Q1_9BACT|nr:RluA family pseudouridine synthase [Corallococcus macrosporus]ATB49470.1 RNA pseudouridine synthase [Corallococcus macrosporus DSM 14697]